MGDEIFFSFCAHKKLGVDLWRPFKILVASLKNHLHIPMLLGASCLNFKNKLAVVFEFLRPQENVTPDARRNGATKIPLPLRAGYKKL